MCSATSVVESQKHQFAIEASQIQIRRARRARSSVVRRRSASAWSSPSAPPSLSTLRASSSCPPFSYCSRRCVPPSMDWKNGAMDSIILPRYLVM
eukprot:8100900-Pyramimonas_sp.AAC.1